MEITQLQSKYKTLLADKKRLAKEKKLKEGQLNNIVTDANNMEKEFANAVEKIKKEHEKKLEEFQKKAEKVTEKQQDVYHQITLLHAALADVESKAKVVRELLHGQGEEVEEDIENIGKETDAEIEENDAVEKEVTASA